MKSNKIIMAALLALGIVSSASASTTVSVGGTNYTEVFITGSTAFRANLFNAVTTIGATGHGTLFNYGSPAVVTHTPNGGAAATASSSVYEALGQVVSGSGATLATNWYIINVSLTGSEAGIASLVGSTITYKVPLHAWMNPSPNSTVTLPGTPQPTFIDPTTWQASPSYQQTLTTTPDLSFADTSVHVSLSAAISPAPVEYGIVGIIPFTWAKGTNSSPDSSWTNLVNVSIPQLDNILYALPTATIFTGGENDQDDVYLIGRNKGSGTRVNMLLDQAAPLTKDITQYAPNNSTYVSHNTLTVGTAAPFVGGESIAENATPLHLITVGNDGFDGGSGVSGTLKYDLNGQGFITLGYLGVSDALGLSGNFIATTNGAWAPNRQGQWLTLDGVAENDTNVLQGAYSFWGHEHVYGTPGQAVTDAGGIVAQHLVGYQAANTQVSGFATTLSALEDYGGLSIFGAPISRGCSTAIDAAAMTVDKGSGADSGYPSPL